MLERAIPRLVAYQKIPYLRRQNKGAALESPELEKLRYLNCTEYWIKGGRKKLPSRDEDKKTGSSTKGKDRRTQGRLTDERGQGRRQGRETGQGNLARNGKGSCTKASATPEHTKDSEEDGSEVIAIDGEGSGPGTETDEEVYEGGKEEDALAAEETKDKESTKDVVNVGFEAKSTSGTSKAKGDEK